MDEEQSGPFKVIAGALTVGVVGDEIVIGGFATGAPSLTPEAARETARLLIAAADQLQRH